MIGTAIGIVILILFSVGLSWSILSKKEEKSDKEKEIEDAPTKELKKMFMNIKDADDTCENAGDESYHEDNMIRSVEKSILLRNATLSVAAVALGHREEMDFSHIESLFEFLENDPILSDDIKFFENASKMFDAVLYLDSFINWMLSNRRE